MNGAHRKNNNPKRWRNSTCQNEHPGHCALKSISSTPWSAVITMSPSNLPLEGIEEAFVVLPFVFFLCL